MITRPTTLILGAGASVHLGYPLGSQLRVDILNTLHAALQHRSPPEELSADIISLIRASDGQSFYDRFFMGDWPSVDFFLAKYPEYQSLGKKLIVHHLKKHENSRALFDRANDGWHRILGQCLLENVQSRKDFKNNRLSIVTYNYDRSIEHYLHQIISHRLRVTSDDAWKLITETIPIIHVHGILGQYPDVPYDNNGDPSRLDECIKIISEIEDHDNHFCSEEFALANEYLAQSDRVISIGFSMSKENIERLRFFHPENIRRRDVLCAIGKMPPMPYQAFKNRLGQYGLTGQNLLPVNSDIFFDEKFLFE